MQPLTLTQYQITTSYDSIEWCPPDIPYRPPWFLTTRSAVFGRILLIASHSEA